MSGTGAPLALDSCAYGQSLGWRRGEDLIDALPYIDALTPEIKNQAGHEICSHDDHGNISCMDEAIGASIRSPGSLDII